jgi:hypothetical protein
MLGKTLYEYDLALCDYVLGNIRCYLFDEGFRRWVAGWTVMPELREYLLEEGVDGDEPQERLQLNDKELNYLQACMEGPDGPERYWVASEPLHKRYVHTVLEVRKELTPQVAEDWSRDCARFAEKLEAPKVTVADGITIVQEWLWALRRHLGAMGANDLFPRPVGLSPTPTDRRPRPSPAPAGRASAKRPAIERMLEAIRTHNDGVNAKPAVLINLAKINKQAGYRALHDLQAQGKYGGFAR